MTDTSAKVYSVEADMGRFEYVLAASIEDAATYLDTTPEYIEQAGNWFDPSDFSDITADDEGVVFVETGDGDLPAHGGTLRRA